MSRVGKMPIAIPAGVTVTVTPENVVTVKGPKGELVKAMHKDINIAVEDAQVVVTRPSDVKEHRALHGLTRALLNNMVVGVSQGFSKTLELNGVGYRAQLQGKKLVMNLGYSHPVEVEAVDGVDFKLDGTTKVIVEGIEYSDEVIRRKEGKTGK